MSGCWRISDPQRLFQLAGWVLPSESCSFQWTLNAGKMNCCKRVPAEQQEEFLRQQCSRDSELIEEVEPLTGGRRR
jgi:hypothetical protein